MRERGKLRLEGDAIYSPREHRRTARAVGMFCMCGSQVVEMAEVG